MTNSKNIIDSILEPYTEAYFLENDASTIASEFKHAKKWQKEELNKLKSQLLQLIKEAMPEKLDKHPQSYKKGELGYDEFREQFLAGLKHGYAKALKDCEANIKALFGSDE